MLNLCGYQKFMCIHFIFNTCIGTLNLFKNMSLYCNFFFIYMNFFFASGSNQSPDLPDNYWHIQCLLLILYIRHTSLTEKRVVSNFQKTSTATTTTTFSWILILLLYKICSPWGNSAKHKIYRERACVWASFWIYVKKFFY